MMLDKEEIKTMTAELLKGVNREAATDMLRAMEQALRDYQKRQGETPRLGDILYAMSNAMACELAKVCEMRGLGSIDGAAFGGTILFSFLEVPQMQAFAREWWEREREEEDDPT